MKDKPSSFNRLKENASKICSSRTKLIRTKRCPWIERKTKQIGFKSNKFNTNQAISKLRLKNTGKYTQGQSQCYFWLWSSHLLFHETCQCVRCFGRPQVSMKMAKQKKQKNVSYCSLWNAQREHIRGSHSSKSLYISSDAKLSHATSATQSLLCQAPSTAVQCKVLRRANGASTCCAGGSSDKARELNTHCRQAVSL